MSPDAPAPLAGARPRYLFVEARDFEGLVSFWRDRVGLPVAWYEPGRYAFLEVGGPGFHLAIYPGRGSAPGPDPHWFAVVDVPDLDAAVAALRARGAPVGEIFPVPHGRAAVVEDPERNRLQLHVPEGS